MVRHPPALLTQSAKGYTLIQEEPQLVFVSQGHQAREITQLTRVHVDAFHHQELTGRIGSLWVLSGQVK